MQYQKSSVTSGAWVKGSELMSGVKAKLVSETQPVPSQFKDKNGNTKNQDIAKIRFENKEDTLNISLNRATIDALVDAFGNDSKDWINKTLVVATEKVLVSGKRVTAVYLIPDGYEMAEDENGYVQIVKKGEKVSSQVDEIDPSEIPF